MNSRRDQDRVQKYSELRKQLSTALRDLRHQLVAVAADVQKLHNVHKALGIEVEKEQQANGQDLRRSSAAHGSPTNSHSNSNSMLVDNAVLQPMDSINLSVSTMERIESEMQRLEIDSSYSGDVDFESHIPRSVVDPVLPDDDSDDGAQLPDILDEYFHTVGDISIIQETYHQDLPAEYHEQRQDLQRRQDQGEDTPVTEADLAVEYERRRAEVYDQLVAAQEKAQRLKEQCQANGISTNPTDYQRTTESVSSDSGENPYNKVSNWLEDMPDKQSSRVVSRRVSSDDLWSASQTPDSRQSPRIRPISDYSLKEDPNFPTETLEPVRVNSRPTSSKNKRQSGIGNNNLEHADGEAGFFATPDMAKPDLERTIPVPSSHDSKMDDGHLKYKPGSPDFIDYPQPDYHEGMLNGPDEFLTSSEKPMPGEELQSLVESQHLGFEPPRTFPTEPKILQVGTESKAPD